MASRDPKNFNVKIKKEPNQLTTVTKKHKTIRPPIKRSSKRYLSLLRPVINLPSEFQYPNPSTDYPVFHKNDKIISREKYFAQQATRLKQIDPIIRRQSKASFRSKNNNNNGIKQEQQQQQQQQQQHQQHQSKLQFSNRIEQHAIDPSYFDAEEAVQIGRMALNSVEKQRGYDPHQFQQQYNRYPLQQTPTLRQPSNTNSNPIPSSSSSLSSSNTTNMNTRTSSTSSMSQNQPQSFTNKKLFDSRGPESLVRHHRSYFSNNAHSSFNDDNIINQNNNNVELTKYQTTSSHDMKRSQQQLSSVEQHNLDLLHQQQHHQAPLFTNFNTNQQHHHQQQYDQPFQKFQPGRTNYNDIGPQYQPQQRQIHQQFEQKLQQSTPQYIQQQQQLLRRQQPGSIMYSSESQYESNVFDPADVNIMSGDESETFRSHASATMLNDQNRLNQRSGQYNSYPQQQQSSSSFQQQQPQQPLPQQQQQQQQQQMKQLVDDSDIDLLSPMDQTQSAKAKRELRKQQRLESRKKVNEKELESQTIGKFTGLKGFVENLFDLEISKYFNQANPIKKNEQGDNIKPKSTTSDSKSSIHQDMTLNDQIKMESMIDDDNELQSPPKLSLHSYQPPSQPNRPTSLPSLTTFSTPTSNTYYSSHQSTTIPPKPNVIDEVPNFLPPKDCQQNYQSSTTQDYKRKYFIDDDTAVNTDLDQFITPLQRRENDMMTNIHNVESIANFNKSPVTDTTLFGDVRRDFINPVQQSKHNKQILNAKANMRNAGTALSTGLSYIDNDYDSNGVHNLASHIKSIQQHENDIWKQQTKQQTNKPNKHTMNTIPTQSSTSRMNNEQFDQFAIGTQFFDPNYDSDGVHTLQHNNKPINNNTNDKSRHNSTSNKVNLDDDLSQRDKKR